jgi:hypothetical protein
MTQKYVFGFLFVLSLTGISASAQATYDPYIAVGVSIADGDFAQNSYPSIEGGVSHRNVTLAASVGRGNFSGAFSNSDLLSNYFVEAKIAPYYDVKKFRGSVFFGYGAYIGGHNFTDVGAGVSYTAGSLSYGIAFNRWDKVNYLSPSVSYNF